MKKLLITITLSVSAILFSQKRDSLQFSLPEKYNLHLEEKQENGQMIMMEYIPKGQNWDNYDIIVTKIVSKNMAKVPLQTLFESNKKILQSKTKNLEIKELSRNKKGEREYILFTAEADSYIDSNDTDLRYIILQKVKMIYLCALQQLKKKNFLKNL